MRAPSRGRGCPPEDLSGLPCCSGLPLSLPGPVTTAVRGQGPCQEERGLQPSSRPDLAARLQPWPGPRPPLLTLCLGLATGWREGLGRRQPGLPRPLLARHVAMSRLLGGGGDSESQLGEGRLRGPLPSPATHHPALAPPAASKLLGPGWEGRHGALRSKDCRAPPHRFQAGGTGLRARGVGAPGGTWRCRQVWGGRGPLGLRESLPRWLGARDVCAAGSGRCPQRPLSGPVHKCLEHVGAPRAVGSLVTSTSFRVCSLQRSCRPHLCMTRLLCFQPEGESGGGPGGPGPGLQSHGGLG